LRSGRLRGGDLLVIEEPEAHLHPENQRRIATLMVRLARMGVYVLCTTHSDIILHQVSNHLLLGEALQKGYEIPEFDPDLDRLDYNEVGVYLFRMEGDGSVIEPVRLEPGFGIPQDEFVRVAEAIGSQTYTLLDILETEAEGSPR
jgi:predicted ATPase